MAKVKAVLDTALGFIISKKLFVFIVACTFLCLSLITESSWLYVSLVYLGMQGVIDTAIKLPVGSNKVPSAPADDKEVEEYS